MRSQLKSSKRALKSHAKASHTRTFPRASNFSLTACTEPLMWTVSQKIDRKVLFLLFQAVNWLANFCPKEPNNHTDHIIFYEQRALLPFYCDFLTRCVIYVHYFYQRHILTTTAGLTNICLYVFVSFRMAIIFYKPSFKCAISLYQSLSIFSYLPPITISFFSLSKGINFWAPMYSKSNISPHGFHLQQSSSSSSRNL